MDKAAFLRQLSVELSQCGRNDRRKSLNYYSELIEDYKEDGMSEQEAVAALGSPSVIAADILEEQGDVRRMSVGMKVLIGVLLVLGFPLWGSLVLAAALLVLNVYILLWCVPLVCGSLTVAALVLGLVSIPGAFAVAAQSMPLGIMQLGLGAVCTGLFFIGTVATVFLCKWFVRLTVRFTRFVIGRIRKEGAVR